MSRAGHVAVVSSISRQNKKRDEFTNISTVSMESSSSNGVSDGQPLWPWSPKRPEKYSIDRAGLPKREELSPGLKLRKACGILLMVAVLFALVIGIYVHFSNSEVDSQHHSHKDKPHGVGTDILVHDNSGSKGSHAVNVTNAANTEVTVTGANNQS